MNDLQSGIYLRDLFEFTSDLIHIINMDGLIDTVNPAWLSNLGYTFEEVKLRSVYDFIDTHDHEAYRNNRKSVIEGGNSARILFALIGKDSSRVLVEGQVRTIKLDGGKYYTQAVLRNVTAEKAIEKRNLDIQKRLTNFFQYAPDAVIVIDQNQLITEWNLKAEYIFGFTNYEVLGQPLSEFIIPQHFREAHKKGMQHFMKFGEGPVLNKTIEITALHKKGKEFPISLSISNIKIDDQWLFVAFISDISERKNMEESLIQHQAELLQSKLMDKKKTDFLTVASHELKTPLTSIKAYTQVALSISKKQSNDQLNQFLSKINDQASKLNHLIAELMDMSRIELGKMGIRKVSCDIGQFLTDVITSIQPIILQHGIVLINSILADVEIDTIRIEQVLVNLINNAAKYSAPNSIIEVSTTLEDGFVIIAVRDFGMGIPPENLDQVFDRYYRVTEISNHVSGFGIGLYISSEIIKLHGGNIWVESELGKGSAFMFSLPVEAY